MGRGFERQNLGGIGAIGDQAADDLGCEAGLHLLDDAEGVGRLEVRARRHRRGCGDDGVLAPEAVRDALSDGWVDVGKLAEHAGADGLGVDLAELEDEGGDDVVLLGSVCELKNCRAWREVVAEGLGADAQLVALFVAWKEVKPSCGSCRGVSASSELGL